MTLESTTQFIAGLRERVVVIAKSLVTWVLALVAVLQYALTQDVVIDTPELADLIGQVLAFLTGAIAIIRQVTPVPKSQRGVL